MRMWALYVVHVSADIPAFKSQLPVQESVPLESLLSAVLTNETKVTYIPQ